MSLITKIKTFFSDEIENDYFKDDKNNIFRGKIELGSEIELVDETEIVKFNKNIKIDDKILILENSKIKNIINMKFEKQGRMNVKLQTPITGTDETTNELYTLIFDENEEGLPVEGSNVIVIDSELNVIEDFTGTLLFGDGKIVIEGGIIKEIIMDDEETSEETSEETTEDENTELETKLEETKLEETKEDKLDLILSKLTELESKYSELDTEVAKFAKTPSTTPVKKQEVKKTKIDPSFWAQR